MCLLMSGRRTGGFSQHNLHKSDHLEQGSQLKMHPDLQESLLEMHMRAPPVEIPIQKVCMELGICTLVTSPRESDAGGPLSQHLQKHGPVPGAE